MYVPIEMFIFGIILILFINLMVVYWVIFMFQKIYCRIEKIEHQFLYSVVDIGAKTINDRIKDLEEFRNHLEGFDEEKEK